MTAPLSPRRQGKVLGLGRGFDEEAGGGGVLTSDDGSAPPPPSHKAVKEAGHWSPNSAAAAYNDGATHSAEGRPGDCLGKEKRDPRTPAAAP